MNPNPELPEIHHKVEAIEISNGRKLYSYEFEVTTEPDNVVISTGTMNLEGTTKDD